MPVAESLPVFAKTLLIFKERFDGALHGVLLRLKVGEAFPLRNDVCDFGAKFSRKIGSGKGQIERATIQRSNRVGHLTGGRFRNRKLNFLARRNRNAKAIETRRRFFGLEILQEMLQVSGMFEH